jgi:hypothetical protein
MRLTLPKTLLRYLQPSDRGHEVQLAIFWATYKRYVRERDGEPSVEMERAMLGDVFHIPENQWQRFRPKAPSPQAKHAKAVQWLAKLSQEYQARKQNHKPNKPKKTKKPKTSVVILRKHSQSKAPLE